MKLQLDKFAEVVENSAKARDKVIEDAKKTRDDKIAYVIRLRDESGTLNKEEGTQTGLRKRIVNINTVSTARDKHREIVSEAKSKLGNMQIKWIGKRVR